MYRQLALLPASEQGLDERHHLLPVLRRELLHAGDQHSRVGVPALLAIELQTGRLCRDLPNEIEGEVEAVRESLQGGRQGHPLRSFRSGCELMHRRARHLSLTGDVCV